jgi:hypothetical protein
MLVLRVVAILAAVLLLTGVLWDVFETVVLPRRVAHRFRLTRAYVLSTWHAWSALARRVPLIERRESVLAIFGPVALLVLLALWVSLLIVAYALLLWGLGSPLAVAGGAAAGFGADLYFSGTTVLTLGLGDVIPHTGPARAVAVLEVGTGFGMLALVIGYLPVLYQAFSRRETRISLLDAHAGSPPTAGTLLLRHPPNRRAERLIAILAEWETWSAELLETHLSYPLLAYYRSQHENQSWVAALAVILDACTLVLVCERGLVRDEELMEQATFTFAIARHAAVDLAQIFRQPPPRLRMTPTDAKNGRLSSAENARLRDLLATVGSTFDAGADGVAEGSEGRLDQLRALYEPYLDGLAEYLLMPLPPWVPPLGALDDWQTTADGVTAPGVAALASHWRTGEPEKQITPGERTPGH